jgi:gas vesicle protein
MRRTIDFLIGVVLGAAVGSAIALLLTPESGEQLRQTVRERTQELVDEGRRAAAAQREDMRAQLEAFKRGTPITLESAPEETAA